MRPTFGLPRSQVITGLLLAAILVVMAVLQGQPQRVEPYDPADPSSTGLCALVLWLEELGYPVTLNIPRTGLPTGSGLLWVHPSSTRDPDFYSRADAALTSSWVRRGGTLVLVGPLDGFTALATEFQVEQIETLSGMVSGVHPVQPLLPNTPGDWESFFASHSLRFMDERAFVPILAQSTGEPVVALQFVGDGVVWHLTEDFALTNLNLRDERIASLLPAILRTVPAGAPVIFSTHHLASHNQANGDAGTVRTLQDWLYTTPFGQGLLVTMIAIFIYLLLQGRRLGPPLPGPTGTRPREAAEYVTALAGLQRRMRQPQLVADHHRQRLKSRVGRIAQIPADLPDAEWLAQLRRAEILSPTLLSEVAELLTAYADPIQVNDEARLIQLVQATDALLASLPRSQTQLVR
ncbi:MAG: DUF4350 domain-containing protein [Caldilineaceae bacterium]|nr:DUF4350 domain-containing protein [Caldilineaceae bacterium]